MKRLRFFLFMCLFYYVVGLSPSYGQCDIPMASVSVLQDSISPGDTVQILLQGKTQPNATYILYKDGTEVNQEQSGDPNQPLIWEVSETGRYTVAAQQDSCERFMDGQPTVVNLAPPDEGGCAELYPILRPTTSDARRCGPGSVTLRASTSYPLPYSIRWYDNKSDFLATGSTYATPSLTRTTNYEVRVERQASDGSFCESPGVIVQAVIDGPRTEAGPNLSVYRGGSPVTLSGASPSGGTWSISPSSAAGALIGNSFDPSHTSVTAGTYTLTYTTEARGTCPASDTRTITVSTLTNNYNYVAHDVFRENTTPTSMNGLSAEERSRSYTYLDGLGRPTEEIQWQGSPGRKDQVQAMVYDNLGRQPRQYLPYSQGTTGNYQSNNTLSFYNSSPEGVTKDSKPYALIEYEASPLNRPLATTGPGNAWHSANKKVTYRYLVNSGGEARKLRIGTGENDAPVSDGFYGGGTLLINTTTDEDNRQVRTYTNKSGEVVLRQVQQSGGWLLTYYVYDDFGNLRYVLPPKAVQQIGSTFSGTAYQNTLRQLAFQYVYDDRQRMIFKRVPGVKAGTEMVYDRRDRLVLSRNALQAQRGQWSFVKYDALNRPVMTGAYANGSNRSTLASSVDGAGLAESRTGGTVGYTLNGSFPTNVSESDVRTVTYYDDYGFTNYTYGGTKQTKPVGQVTGSRTNVLGSSTWLTTVIYYDDRYRPVHAISENHKGGTDKIKNTYDFVGNVLTTKRVHSNTNLTVQETYRYDHQDRLLNVQHRINGGAPVTVAEYEYNELGELIEKNLHRRGSEPVAQSVDYRYTIRGWLKSINDRTLENNAATNPDPSGQPADLFGAELLYERNTLGLPTP